MRWLVVVLFALGCHNDPPPEEPMPVSSTGTPIGFLIDDAQMHLSTDQLGQLRGFDANLRTQLEQLAAASKKLGSAAPPPQQQPVQPIGGRRGRRGMGGQGMGSGQRRAAGPNAAAADKLADERTEDVKAALEHVFAVLDATQQARARQVLSDHDIDIDLDEVSVTPAPVPAPPPALPPPAPTPPAAQEPAQLAPPPTIPPPSKADSH